MADLKSEIASLEEKEGKLVDNKVANFAYTDTAYNTDDANGHNDYVYSRDNNIPVKDLDVINVNETVITKGYRSQASSVTRMFMNHFLGRVSYNLNKTVDVVKGLLTQIKSYIGQPNGLATLDETGRVPLEQLPESTIVYKGQWNASTNTPHLVNGTGTQGDFYEVNVAGWFNAETGESSSTEAEGYVHYFSGDGIIYDGSSWNRRGSGAVKTVNGVAPELGDVKNVIPISKNDFENLKEEETAGKFYIVSDGSTDPLTLINDVTPSDNSAYSSNKVNELLASKGTGEVSSVNNKKPGTDGNVTLGASDVGALGVTSSVNGEISLESTEGIKLTQTNDSTRAIELDNRGTGNILLSTNTGNITARAYTGNILLETCASSAFVNIKGNVNIGTEADRKNLVVYGDIRVGGDDTQNFPKSIRFGDNDNAYIKETDDDYLKIYSSNPLTLCSGGNVYLQTPDSILLCGNTVEVKQGEATSYSKVATVSMFSYCNGTLTINM